MKTVNVNDVLRILYKYGQFIFVTDEKKYTEMMDEIANLPSMTDTTLDAIKTEVIERDRNVKTVRSDGRCLFTAEEVLEIIDKYRGEKTSLQNIKSIL